MLFNPSCTRIGTAVASRSQETRSLPRVSRTWKTTGDFSLEDKLKHHRLQFLLFRTKLYFFDCSKLFLEDVLCTYQVGHTVEITAHGQEDDGPFRVGETL